MTRANRGFIAIAIDGRYHGERAGNPPGLATPYTTAIFNAYKSGREYPFFYDTVLDVMRLVDYLETRADVDRTRIGLGGFSKGGIETYLAAAIDPRIAAAVSGHGVQSFKWGLDHGAWDSRAWTIATPRSLRRTNESPVNAAFVRKFYNKVGPNLRRVRWARRCCRSSRRGRCWSSTAIPIPPPIAGVKEAPPRPSRRTQQRALPTSRAANAAERRPRADPRLRERHGRVVRGW